MNKTNNKISSQSIKLSQEINQRIDTLVASDDETEIIKSLKKLTSKDKGNKSVINSTIFLLNRVNLNDDVTTEAVRALGKIAVGDKDAIAAMESELKFSSSKAVKDRVSVNLNKIDPGNKAAADYRLKMKKARSTKK